MFERGLESEPVGGEILFGVGGEGGGGNEFQVIIGVHRLSSPGGGGYICTLIFSAYVGSDPASTVHPKKISGISSNPQKYLKF